MVKGTVWSLAYRKLGREQRNHLVNYYFCLVNIKDINWRNQSRWTYLNLDLAKQIVLQLVEIPVPSFIHIEKLPEEDEFFTSSVHSSYEQSDCGFEGI